MALILSSRLKEHTVTRTASRRTRALAVVSAILVAGAALVGCSTHPGAAAVVTYTASDGASHTIRVSEADVQAAYTEYAMAQGMETTNVLQGLVDVDILDQIVPQYGIVVTDEDGVAHLEELMGPGTYSKATIDLARLALMDSAVGGLDEASLAAVRTEYQAAAESMSADIAPRYTPQTWVISDAVPYAG